MLNWISQNIGTIAVCTVLIIIVAGIIFSMVRNKKKGKNSCGCGCKDCAMSGICHEKK